MLIRQTWSRAAPPLPLEKKENQIIIKYCQVFAHILSLGMTGAKANFHKKMFSCKISFHGAVVEEDNANGLAAVNL